MAYVADPMSQTGLAGPGATSITAPNGASGGAVAPKPGLTPANNAPTRATPQGVQSAGQQQGQPPPAPQAQPGANGSLLYPPGQGPVTAGVPSTSVLKASPMTPQPQNTQQVGQVLPPMMLGGKQGNDLLSFGEEDDEEETQQPVRTGKALAPDLGGMFGISKNSTIRVSVNSLVKVAKDLLVDRYEDAMDVTWRPYSLSGAEALKDLERFQPSSAHRRSGFQIPEMAEAGVPKPITMKQASALPAISPFAAAFFLGCRSRGMSIGQVKQAIKSASAANAAIAEELAVLSSEACPVLEKCAAMDKEAGILDGAMNLGGKALQFGSRMLKPIMGGAPAGAGWNQGVKGYTNFNRGAQQAGGWFSRANPAGGGWTQPGTAKTLYDNVLKPLGGMGVGSGLGTLANMGLDATLGFQIPGLELAGGLIGGGGATRGGRRMMQNVLPKSVQPYARKAMGVLSGQAAGTGAEGIAKYTNPAANAAAYGLPLAEAASGYDLSKPRQAMKQFGRDQLNSHMQEATGMSFDDMVNSPMGRVMRTYNQQGMLPALQAGWGELTPQQQTGLMMALGGPLLGAGAAAMGHSGIGMGLAAGGLGLGAHQMWQGGGNAMALPQGLPQSVQQQMAGQVQQNPGFFQHLQQQPRSTQHNQIQQMLEQLQSQQSGAELARARGQ